MASTTMASDRYAVSIESFRRARRVLPGGVNSPVRAYNAVGQVPLFTRSGCGARVTDQDGHKYIDYVGSYGPLILGHTPPTVIAAIHDAAKLGISFGMPTESETSLAEMVVEAVPAIDVVRFVNSGTESVMSAIRLARAATQRPKLVKCTGCYHGHADAMLVQAGSGATTLGVPSSPGVPAGVTDDTLLVPFNDLDAAACTFSEFGDTIACMVVEPIAGNMGCIRPKVGYLEGLRTMCDKHGALLLFDEVMTGFRVAYGGAQQLYGVKPDLTCLGKVIGGGLPCAAYGGRETLMRQVAPDGPVYQAGTLSGNPLAMAAGIATLKALRDSEAYTQLERSGTMLVEQLRRAAARSSVPVVCTHVGSMVSCFFVDDAHQGNVENYEQAITCDTRSFALFFHAMLERGVMLPPSQFETWFLSTAHDDDILNETTAAANEAFAIVAAANETPRTK